MLRLTVGRPYFSLHAPRCFSKAAGNSMHTHLPATGNAWRKRKVHFLRSNSPRLVAAKGWRRLCLRHRLNAVPQVRTANWLISPEVTFEKKGPLLPLDWESVR
jgi:hypothetical protein